MNEKLIVSPSPHLKSQIKTKNIMLDVIIALVPAVVASVILFGFSALLLVAVTVVACVLSEYCVRKIMKRDATICDLSAVVTGILLALTLPVGLPLWMAILGGMIAIVLVKQLFGGLGHNFVNPALTARAILFISFPLAMTFWPAPFQNSSVVEAVSEATPLALLSAEYAPNLPSHLDLFLGNHPGAIGEVSALALLLGGIYLIIKKVIKPTIPLFFMGTVFVLALLFGEDPVIHLLSGGLFLGAIFMATDYTTSPLTGKGKVIYAIGCGILTIIIRVFGDLPEGISFAIIVMNILVPFIDKLTMPKPFKLKEAKR